MTVSNEANLDDVASEMWEYAARLSRIDLNHPLLMYYNRADEPEVSQEFLQRFGNSPECYTEYVRQLRDAIYEYEYRAAL